MNPGSVPGRQVTRPAAGAQAGWGGEAGTVAGWAGEFPPPARDGHAAGGFRPGPGAGAAGAGGGVPEVKVSRRRPLSPGGLAPSPGAAISPFPGAGTAPRPPRKAAAGPAFPPRHLGPGAAAPRPPLAGASPHAPAGPGGQARRRRRKAAPERGGQRAWPRRAGCWCTGAEGRWGPSACGTSGPGTG